MSCAEIEDPPMDNLESKLVENPLKLASIALSQPSPEVFTEEKAYTNDTDSRSDCVRDALEKELIEVREYLEGCIAAERLDREQQFNDVRAIAAEFREQAASVDEALQSMQEAIVTSVLTRLEQRLGQDDATIHSSSSSEELSREGKPARVTASQLQELDMKFCQEAQALGEALSAEAAKLRREFCCALKAEHCEWTRLAQGLDVERQRGNQCLEALTSLEISFGELRQYLKSARSSEEKSQSTTLRDRVEQLERKVALQCSEQCQTSEQQGQRLDSLERAQRLSKDAADIAYNRLEDVITAVQQVKALQVQLQERCNDSIGTLQAEVCEESGEVQAMQVADVQSVAPDPGSPASMVVEDALTSEEDVVHQPVRPRPALISLMKAEDATGSAQDGTQVPDRTCPVPTMVRRSLSLGVLPGQTWAARSNQAQWHAHLRAHGATGQTSQPAPTEALEKNLNRLARDINRTLRQLQEQGEVSSRSPSPRRAATMQAPPPEAPAHIQPGVSRPAAFVEGSNFKNLTRPATEVTTRSASVQLPPSFPRAVTPYRGQLSIRSGNSVSTPRIPQMAKVLPDGIEAAVECRGTPRDAPVNVVRRQVSLPSGGEECGARPPWAAQCRPFTYACPAASATAWQTSPPTGDMLGAPLPTTRIFRSPSPMTGATQG
mmetsp:Transcript_30086/g.54881  ORF Transcript_30086/g.54881 Transcript_30086/m.54881 type:complete len:664 (+) Transcript_30086:118-2109(+)